MMIVDDHHPIIPSSLTLSSLNLPLIQDQSQPRQFGQGHDAVFGAVDGGLEELFHFLIAERLLRF